MWDSESLPFILMRISRKEGRKEGNVLFNDALNTFYSRLYGVRYMIKDHSDSEWKEGRNSFILRRTQHILFTVILRQTYDMHHHTDRIAHTAAFVAPVVDTGWNEK